MVAPGGGGVEDSPSASSSSSHVMTNHLASPMRSLSSASGGLYVSAPGKIILFGEHAVVYGRTAIAGSIDLRTYVSLFTSADGRIYLSLPDLGVERTWMLKDLLKACERLNAECPIDEGPPPLEIVVPIARKLSGACEDQCGVQHLAILAFWYLLIGVVQRKRDLLAVKVTVRFKLPACVGLGSSGAFCVCIATALLQTAGLIPPPSISVDEDGSLTWDEVHLDMIRKWSAAAESLIHGRASGLDAAVCTYGGIASYKPGKRIDNLQNVPDLKVILVNSKVERNTSRMVQTVRDRLKKFPTVIDSIFTAIDSIAQEAARILERPLSDENGGAVVENGGRSATLTPSFVAEADHHSLQQLCQMNNNLLIALGVGHAKVDQICTLLGRYGIHPKMTGAGGGGSVFAFLKPDTSQTVLQMIRDELTKEGYEVWQPSLGGAGVQLHQRKPDLFASSTAASSRSNTPSGSHQSTPAIRHKK